MKKIVLMALVSLGFFSTAHADICGIVKTNQGRAASNIIRAQIARNGQYATLYDDFSNSKIHVVDALVSNKNGADLDGSKYFDFRVKTDDGKEVSVDIGHTYMLLEGTKTAISLNALTGCGSGVADSKPLMKLVN